jgi:hypothetical protein
MSKLLFAVGAALLGVAAGATPDPAHAAVPLPATDHSAEVLARRVDNGGQPTNVPEKQKTCAEQINQPCQQNADCACSKFCYFAKGTTVTQGSCQVYDRAVHSA